MTSHTGRLYALALALFVFFLTWTAVGARPWATASKQSDPRLTALATREQRLRQESLAVQKVVRRRWNVYRVELRQRQAQIAAVRHAQLAAAPAPSVRVVTLPPLTVTRTS
jgi:hypothetical protein